MAISAALARILEGALLRYIFDKPSRSEVQSQLFEHVVGTEYQLEIPDREENFLSDEGEIFERIDFKISNVRVENRGSIKSFLFEDWQVLIMFEFETDSLLKYDSRDSKSHFETWLPRLLIMDGVEVAGVILEEGAQLGKSNQKNARLGLVFNTHDIFTIKEGVDKFSYLIGEYFSMFWQSWKYSMEEKGENLPITYGLQSLAMSVANQTDNEDLKERASDGFLKRNQMLLETYSEVKDMPDKNE